MNNTKSENLLQTGNNELQLLEFRVGDNSYGVDVTKVHELLQYCPVQPIPNAPTCVEGIICPRNQLVTVIELAAYLQHPPSGRADRDIFVIAEVNQGSFAFHVHQVIEIHQISQDEIEIPDMFRDGDGVVTGVVKKSGVLICILDFEKIMIEING
ncbi:chemotaxis protein CheW [Desulforamulus aeronauticus]|uniref:Chemotaxis signal transduction protein n=1 Tax=Desulforamulus aeronauticus DSM 10349 TaxID=1121421 RepID=A0A1M6PC20_9FIRM|nr:chemotaxis protein CheW [Desulforamulus aeronauticus]SHK05509.1 Chemotaxis signal transduction protein [Desulforamulus aeronauticus DSM 10349]